MLGMMFVQLVITRASLTRIVEVLDEEIDIKNPAPCRCRNVPDEKQCFKVVTNGAIEFPVVFHHQEFKHLKVPP